MHASRAWLSLVTALSLTGACGEATVIGSTCQAGTCPELPSCQAAQQQYPVECDMATRSCLGGDQFLPDQEVCDGCYEMLDRVNIDSPLGPCACTYCGVQLTRCFESGNATRDQACIDVVRCAWFHGCTGMECFCGEGVEFEECFANDAARARGPCKEQIDRAVGECSGGQSRYWCMYTAYMSFETAMGRVGAVSQCVSGDPIIQTDDLDEGQIVPRCR